MVARGRTTVERAESLGNVKYVGRPVAHAIDSDEARHRQRQAARKDLDTMLEPKR